MNLLLIVKWLYEYICIANNVDLLLGSCGFLSLFLSLFLNNKSHIVQVMILITDFSTSIPPSARCI